MSKLNFKFSLVSCIIILLITKKLRPSQITQSIQNGGDSFYLQNRLIQTVKQEVNGTVILPPLVFPGYADYWEVTIVHFNAD